MSTETLPAPFMYTQCPACKTVFRLRPEQLNAAQGQVRCSRCQTVFNAADNLFQTSNPDEAGSNPPPTKEASAGKTKHKTLETEKALTAARKKVVTQPSRPSASSSTTRRPSNTSESHRTRTTGKEAPRPQKKVEEQNAVSGKKRGLDRTVKSQPKPATATPAKPETTTTDEETLPLFGPGETPSSKRNNTVDVLSPSGADRKVKNTEDPIPLFEFQPPIDEQPIAPDSAPSSKKNESKALKGIQPPAEAPEELDLFASNESNPTERDDELLFRYSPEESAGPDLAAEENDAPKKERETSRGYSLPLESNTDRGNLFGKLLWSGGIVLLLAGLALQYLYYHRMGFAEEPRLRPVLERMCRITSCQLPPQRDLAQIELGKHLVQVHPRYTDSLLITATLVNRADFAQPYPIVEVLMTDLEQQQVARRRFLPSEYLIGSNSEHLLPPETEVPLMLEVLDPGKNAVGFEFNFY